MPRWKGRNTVSTALVRRDDARPPTGLALPPRQLAAAQRYLAAARAPNTHLARRADWRVFTAWCDANARPALPAGVDTVFSFLLDQVDMHAKKPATLARYLTSIATAHGGAGLPDPTKEKRIAELMDGVRRVRGTRQRLAAPVTHEVLTAVKPHCDLRDWAVVCFGQALAARRSELCALDVADLKFEAQGVAVTFRRSKTDQEGKGAVIGVRRLPGSPLCPVAALEAYLQGRASGPVFRGTRAAHLTPMEVHRTVKRVVAAAGYDPALYSGHSLRAGYVTDARRAGQSWTAIMGHTRHSDLKTVKGYARYDVDPFATAPKEA